MSTQSLLWGVLFSSIGLGLFIYGKRQAANVPFICGMALMVVPYFIDSTWLMVGVGGALTALPLFLRF